MPNYNYRSNDYMRRGQCARQVMPAPARIEHECTSHNEDHSSDHCMNDLLNGLPIAMAYVPWQEWCGLYPAEKALCRGTIFEELDKPFWGIGGCVK